MIYCKSLLGFDFNLIDEYNEAEVREKIIDPIIEELGYKPSGKNIVVREKTLKNPFLRVGSKYKKVETIPDYVMMINNESQWVLEAKAPHINIDLPKHIEQAYSYASHIEIQAKYFALCNGKHFALYSLNQEKPILKFNMKDIHIYMEELFKLLYPSNIILAKGFKKDLGMYLLKQNISPNTSLFYYDLETDNITRLNETTFTIGRTIQVEENLYEASFDFSYDIFLKLRDKLPKECFERLDNWDNHITKANLVGGLKLNLKCQLSNEIIEVEREMFKPLIIVDIF